MSFQIWLPEPDERRSLSQLNNEHLNELRWHILELVETFHRISPGDSALPDFYERHPLIEADHPILEQFIGYEVWLIGYGMSACDEWQMRNGKRDPLYEALAHHMDIEASTDEPDPARPNWFGSVEFHLSHQAALLRADETHYKAYYMTGNARALVVPRSDHA